MNLQLSLKRKWFDMTKARIKPEDYRDITPYWCNKLLLFEGKSLSKKEWEKILNWYEEDGLQKLLLPNVVSDKITFKSFDYNIMTLGYPSKDDTERILKNEHAGIEIRTGKPEWGAEPNKLYFVIKHGKQIDF